MMERFDNNVTNINGRGPGGSRSGSSQQLHHHEPGEGSPPGGQIARVNSSGKKRAHFADGERQYDLPHQVYNRYAEMDDAQSPDRNHEGAHTGAHRGAHAGAQYPADTPVDIEQVTTLYIPKNKYDDDGNKTLIRRRRTSSKKRSSSKRKHERENLDDLMNEEDNHILPSLRLQRRIRTKTLKERKSDLEEERAEITEHDGGSFRTRVQDLKDRDDLTAGHFADLLRDSTMKRMRGLGEWTEPRKILSECQTDWILMRRRVTRRLIWIQTVCKEKAEVYQMEKRCLPTVRALGRHGTAVMSFFRFVRWLMLLNVFLMIIMFCVTTIPFLSLKPRSFKEMINVSESTLHFQAVNCSENYAEYHDHLLDKESGFEKVLDFLQGTGWMERTVLFVGHYYNKTYNDHEGEVQTYNMGLAYLLAIGACFFVSFILLVRNSAKTVKATFGIEGSVAAFTNRVFGGWDYAITSFKAAKTKQRNISKHLKDCLAEEKRKQRQAERTANDKATLFFIRFIVNAVVICVLGAALFLVYFTTDKLLQLQDEELNEIVALIVQYLPYLTITILNFAIPLVFQKLVFLEDYSHNIALRITLARSILLRLASLIVLIGSLYRLLIIEADPDNGLCGNRLWEKNDENERGNIKCWETYVGQQIYKLVLLDLVVETSIIVFIQFPRRLIYNKFKDRFNIVKKIGPQEFDLPQSVIDIIYSQTLCWLGLFFSPLIPFMTFLKCLIFFYLRKWTLLKNCTESGQQFRTSRSHSLFMFVLLSSFVLTVVPIGYIISSIAPSQSCGPFRVYSSDEYVMFDAVTVVVRTWPAVLRDILLFLGTVGFLLPVIFLLMFYMYYNWLLSQGYKKREKLLSEQLKLEGKDKQFLLTRVNEVLRHIEGT